MHTPLFSFPPFAKASSALYEQRSPPTESKAAHHAISTLFPTPIDPKDKPLVVQYEVKLQKGLECGGAYIKLLTEEDGGVEGLRTGAEYTDKVSRAFTLPTGTLKAQLIA